MDNEAYIKKESYITARPEVYKWRFHVNHLLIQETLRFVGNDIVDFGCNHGACTIIMSDYGKKVVGFDINKKALVVAEDLLSKQSEQSRQLVEYRHSAFDKLDAKDDSFSGGYMFDVFEHIFPKDRQEIIDEFRRVLKKDAILIISTPYKFAYDCPEHVVHYDKDELEVILSDLGVEVLNIRRFNKRDMRGEMHDQIHAMCKFN